MDQKSLERRSPNTSLEKKFGITSKSTTTSFDKMHRREEDYIETAEQIEDVEPLPKQMVSLVYNAGDYETIRELTVKESEIYQKMVPHNLFPVPVGNIMVVIGANLGSNCPSFHSLSLWMILTGCTSILIHMVNVSYLQVAGYLSTHHMIPGWTTITIISLKIVGMILNALEAVALIITTTIIAELYIDGEEIFAREPVSICQGVSDRPESDDWRY